MAFSILRHGRTTITRRCLSSGSGPKHHPKIGVITRRKKPAATGGSGPVRQTPSNPAGDLEKAVISPETTRNNVLLAVTLLGCCGSIIVYSMTAVGQAGAPVEGGEDPLEILKKEASEAQVKKEQEDQEMADAQDMIEKVKSGAYDPDNYEDLEEEEPKKRPWWKFW